MKREQEEPCTAELEESGPAGTNRREFLGKSLGAVPVVLTVGNRHGWGGNSIHGTLWSSTGTDWKHRGHRWWRGRGWDRPKPPHFSDESGNTPRHGPQELPASRPDWDWQTPREDWRPEETEPSAPDWDWKSDERVARPSPDVPVHPIDETIRDKK